MRTARHFDPLGPLGGLLALVGIVAVMFAPAPVAAQAIAERRMGVRFEAGVPVVDVSAADFAADAETRRKLASGLPQTLVFRTYAYTSDAEVPVAVSARSCRVVYDLWEERYRVQIANERGDRTSSVATVQEVVSLCLVAQQLPIGTSRDWEALHGRDVTFAVLVELNPLTADTVQRVRRWLARPQRGRVDSDSFFGSFVSLFVNRGIGAAERTLRFRSQEVTVP